MLVFYVGRCIGISCEAGMFVCGWNEVKNKLTRFGNHFITVEVVPNFKFADKAVDNSNFESVDRFLTLKQDYVI